MAQPARDLFERDRSRYHGLLFKLVWLVETARGCPFRCNFCSVWQLLLRTQRMMKASAYLEEHESCTPRPVEIPGEAAAAS